MAEKLNYWAFISYSHADEAWAKWLHNALETYRVPRRLVGGAGPFGPRPRRLFPVFRDRDELSSAAELSSVIEAALRESRFLIVICSPNSARSKWVDAEIRRYKALGRENRILALIVDGEPHATDAAQECFPEALRYKVNRRGDLTDEPSEPIAADARPFADHKHGAKLKLISALLGVGYDELRQRERQRRFWMKVQLAVAGFAGIALLAGLWGWFQQREAHLIETARVDRIVHLGIQELNKQRNARAAVYFTEALRAGRDNVPLRYWLARAMQPVDAVERRLRALGEVIIYATGSTDGRHLFTVAANKAGWWDLEAASLIHRHEIPQAAFHGLPQISPDGRYAVISGGASIDSAQSQSLCTIIDLQVGRIVATVPGSIWTGGGEAISPDSGRILLSQQPGSDSARKAEITVHDLSNGEKLATLSSADGVAIPSFSADGRHILTGGEGKGEIRIWSASDYRLVRGIQPRQRISHAAYWSGRGEEILSISEAGAIKLWDGQTGELVDALGGHSLFALAPDQAAQRYWVTTSIDGTRVWDLESGQALLSTDQFGGFNTDIELDSSGEHLLAVEPDGGTSLWNVAERGREQFLDVHGSTVAAQYFDRNDERIVSISGDGVVRWLQTDALAQPRTRLQHENYVNPLERPGVGSAILSGDGTHWISGGADGAIRLWDTTTGAPRGYLRAHDAMIQFLTLSGELIFSADSTGRVVAWDGASDKPVWTFEFGGSLGDLHAAQESPRLVALAEGGKVQLLDTITGNALGAFEAGPQAISATLLRNGELLINELNGRAAVMTPDGKSTVRALRENGPSPVNTWRSPADGGQIVQTGEDGIIRVVDLQNGSIRAQLDLRETAAASLYVSILIGSHDLQWIAAGTLEGLLVLWQPDSGVVRILEGHSQTIQTVAFDPTGRLLASTSRDGEIIVWDMQSGQLLQRLGQSREVINLLAFDPSGTRLLSNERLNNSLRLWDVHQETRPLDAIQAQINCAVPWKLDGLNLSQRQPVTADCEVAATASRQ
ncbi:MAG: TIR domain-containing protein [Pseudomonadota bacterium]|nr:TIR domain-containing protein [Pseudomonadota bacterium]